MTDRSVPESGTDPLASTAWHNAVPFFSCGEHLPLLRKVADLRKNGEEIFPAQDRIFRALLVTDYPQVRVIILGQDPYPGRGQADGLAFSVSEGIPLPRSLANIRKEILQDVYGGIVPPHWGGMGGALFAYAAQSSSAYREKQNAGPAFCAGSGSLQCWAEQGVLLLNTSLTVQAGRAASHKNLGWQKLTSAVLSAVAESGRPTAVLLWGGFAAKYAPLFEGKGHLVLQAAHPSPLSASRGFFGCGHFSAVNRWLASRGEKEILW